MQKKKYKRRECRELQYYSKNRIVSLKLMHNHITEVRPLSLNISFCVSDIFMMMADLDSQIML